MTERRFVRIGLMVTATILGCVAALPAAAQGEAYIGASYLDTGGEFDTSVGTFDDDDSGWKIFAGYTISPHVAAEISYYDLGNYSDTEGFNSFSADVNAYDLAIRGILPVGQRFEVFAKIGYSLVDVESTLDGPLVSVSAEATDWEFIYGVGVGLKLGPKFGLRAEYEGWDTEGELDALSVGAYFRFARK